MNGKPGDDPALDIVKHGVSVYSTEVDALVRELAKFMDFRRLQDLLHSRAGLSVEHLRIELQKKVRALRAEAHDRGWEIEELE